MEYTHLWQPVLLIASTLFIGLVLGALYMYRKICADNDLIQVDLDVAHEKIHELLRHYNVARKKDKLPNTKLDDSFKQQLRNKDDELDRVQASRENLKKITTGLNKNLETAASQILILEDRISINKKVAIEREEELSISISKITDQLGQIEELEKDKQFSSDDEIQNLTVAIKKRDNSIIRLNKRILELEVDDEEDEERLGGGVQNWKRIE